MRVIRAIVPLRRARRMTDRPGPRPVVPLLEGGATAAQAPRVWSVRGGRSRGGGSRGGRSRGGRSRGGRSRGGRSRGGRSRGGRSRGGRSRGGGSRGGGSRGNGMGGGSRPDWCFGGGYRRCFAADKRRLGRV